MKFYPEFTIKFIMIELYHKLYYERNLIRIFITRLTYHEPYLITILITIFALNELSHLSHSHLSHLWLWLWYNWQWWWPGWLWPGWLWPGWLWQEWLWPGLLIVIGRVANRAELPLLKTYRVEDAFYNDQVEDCFSWPSLGRFWNILFLKVSLVLFLGDVLKVLVGEVLKVRVGNVF